jgi:hypothetical protein
LSKCGQQLGLVLERKFEYKVIHNIKIPFYLILFMSSWGHCEAYSHRNMERGPLYCTSGQRSIFQNSKYLWCEMTTNNNLKKISHRFAIKFLSFLALTGTPHGLQLKFHSVVKTARPGAKLFFKF